MESSDVSPGNQLAKTFLIESSNQFAVIDVPPHKHLVRSPGEQNLQFIPSSLPLRNAFRLAPDAAELTGKFQYEGWTRDIHLCREETRPD